MNSRLSTQTDTLTSLNKSVDVLKLNQCAKNAHVRITDIFPQPLFGTQDERVTLRLKELGFLPGTVLSVIGFGLLGRDPIAVKINGTKFALRQAEAAKIGVEYWDAKPNARQSEQQ